MGLLPKRTTFDLGNEKEIYEKTYKNTKFGKYTKFSRKMFSSAENIATQRGQILVQYRKNGTDEIFNCPIVGQI